MIGSIARSVGSIVAGLVATMLLVFATELVSNELHPWPPGADVNDSAAMEAQVISYPTWVLALCMGLWGIAAFAGVWVATRLGTGRHPAHGFVVGILILLMAGVNILILPYVMWFKTLTPLLLLVAIFAGVRAGSGETPAPKVVVAD